jgi:antitoxin CptB
VPEGSESDQGHRQDQGIDDPPGRLSPWCAVLAHRGQTTERCAMDTLLDERALSKLHWRCRRGLLENDLFIERFFSRHESSLTVRQARGLEVLMDLADNDLLDLLLRRREPEGDLAEPDVKAVLEMLRQRRPDTDSDTLDLPRKQP